MTAYRSPEYFHDSASRTLYLMFCESSLTQTDVAMIMDKVCNGKISTFQVADTFVDGIRTKRLVVNLDRDWKG